MFVSTSSITNRLCFVLQFLPGLQEKKSTVEFDCWFWQAMNLLQNPEPPKFEEYTNHDAASSCLTYLNNLQLNSLDLIDNIVCDSQNQWQSGSLNTDQSNELTQLPLNDTLSLVTSSILFEDLDNFLKEANLLTELKKEDLKVLQQNDIEMAPGSLNKSFDLKCKTADLSGGWITDSMSDLYMTTELGPGADIDTAFLFDDCVNDPANMISDFGTNGTIGNRNYINGECFERILFAK